MISRFFIDRPIFASVLSIVITLAGGIAVFTLPLAQFPNISPPTVSVTCQYPGASAQDVADSVAAPIEEQVNGVENMMYMSSSSTNDGSYNLQVTFRHGMDLDMAQVMVQNRIALALPRLPEVIRQTGVTTKKRSPDILMGFAITSNTPRYNQLYLSNYVIMQVKDELARLEGVSDVMVFGQRDYSMRIWLNPDKLATRNLTAGDVANALREQNQQLATGQIGQPPVRQGQQLQVTLSTLGRLETPEQFENLILRASRDGKVIRLKDVARVGLGPKNEDTSCRFNGKDSAFLAIFQTPDANALETKARVMAKMAELGEGFPEGIVAQVAFDTTPYTSESINEVVQTLRDAVILVAIVVLVFLQNWRSAIIPLVAVPVAIIGTFAAMKAIDFSLNNLTLFGLVLAIGIVVDDAIVVVEAVEHYMEQGLPPREATIKAMEMVSGPVIAVGCVLSAVFVPCAFISGITGQFFRQFALTIAVSTLISAFNSLTLSPALTALLLRPREKHGHQPLPRTAFLLLGGWLSWKYLTPWLHRWLGQLVGAGFQPAVWLNATGWKPVTTTVVAGLAGAAGGWLAGNLLNVLMGGFFRGFNTAFRYATHGYTRTIGMLLRVSVLVLVVYGGLLGLTYYTFTQTPKGFIPTQDMGYLLVNVQLPDAASMERTEQVMKQVYRIAKETGGVRHVTTIAGQSFVLNAIGSNFGSVFVNLKDYADRRDPSLHSDRIAAVLRRRFATEVSDAMIAVFGPPPVRGAGRAGGFAIMIEDRGSLGPTALQKETEKLVMLGNRPDPKANPWIFGANGKPKIVGLFSVFRANVPQLKLIGDTREFSKKGVSTRDFADTLSIFEGSLYVNDFNLFGRTWQVIIQAEPGFRTRLEDLARLKVRNARGGMVPLGSLGTAREVNGPLALTRYNMYPAASINGTAGLNVSSADAIAVMQRLADQELPKAMKYEWTDMSYLELLAGDTATVIFGFAVVMVFLVLAALYESWSLPLAVILVVPMCLLSALAGVNFVETDVNIFTRIGFVVLVGLASKNAILIVEFAKVRREQGESRRQATLEACQLRLRPIVMTSLAFILGVLPLVIAQGAGAEMRRALGLAVFSGMIGVTLFGIFLTPVFFYVINWLSDAHLFTARRVELAGEVALNVLTLGFRRWPDVLRHLRRLRAGGGFTPPVSRGTGGLHPPLADTNGIVTALPQTPTAHPDGFVKQK